MINLVKLYKSRLTQSNIKQQKYKEHKDMITQENQTDKRPRDDLT